MVFQIMNVKTCPSGHGPLSVRNSPDYQEKIKNFHKFVETKIQEHSIGPDDIINMDEAPLTFALPLTRTVNKTGASSVLLKTTGHEENALHLRSGMHGIRTTTSTTGVFSGIVVKVNTKGWMMEGLMKEWLTECYSKRAGGVFHRKKALLVLDSMRAHITDSVEAAITKTNSIPAVIPGVDPNSVECCERIHDHQRVPKGWTATRRERRTFRANFSGG
ncbi:hypothetical protein D4764_14G0001740 [Takifugu flavidus]|uniref:DDE-1 domain-containing protein n=1 Tax=Takifugu flavidus TaxID=433684 RepID=A0A5C6P3M3_9TELE|nr:hypothetical protein D4764_14G0001740 [Takifugu flavidus]